MGGFLFDGFCVEQVPNEFQRGLPLVLGSPFLKLDTCRSLLGLSNHRVIRRRQTLQYMKEGTWNHVYLNTDASPQVPYECDAGGVA